MDGPRDYHIKLRKPDKDKYMISLMWNLKKNDTNELIYKTEIDSETQKTNLWLPKWGRGSPIPH